MLGEFKMTEIKENAVNECFYHMHGQCINLVTKTISNGHLVLSFTMYGIVVAIDKPGEAWLLKLVSELYMYISQSTSC